jgi:hypothetical protein
MFCGDKQAPRRGFHLHYVSDFSFCPCLTRQDARHQSLQCIQQAPHVSDVHGETQELALETTARPTFTCIGKCILLPEFEGYIRRSYLYMCLVASNCEGRDSQMWSSLSQRLR